MLHDRVFERVARRVEPIGIDEVPTALRRRAGMPGPRGRRARRVMRRARRVRRQSRDAAGHGRQRDGCSQRSAHPAEIRRTVAEFLRRPGDPPELVGIRETLAVARASDHFGDLVTRSAPGLPRVVVTSPPKSQVPG